MWNKAILILTLQMCAQISAKSIYRGNHNERPEQVAVNQHVYYPQQYGEAFQDLTSYMQKLHQQGLIQPIDHKSQPFVLPHNSYGYVYPSYPTYQVEHEQQQQQNMATAPAQGTYYYQPNFIPSISTDYYGEHKVNHNENLSSHGTIGQNNNVNDKKPIIKHLNTTIQKVSDNIEHKVNAIKVYVEKSVHDINKLGDDVYKQVGDKASKIFDSINKKLEKIEHQLHYARIDDENINLDELAIDDDDEDMSRTLFDEDEKNELNVVYSEIGSQSSDEMRTLQPGFFSNALKTAQENFNKLIEAKVAAVNGKIAAVNSRVESVFNKLQATLQKLKLRQPTVDHNGATTPMPFAQDQYTTIQWKPRETAWQHQTQPQVSTPAYFQYTVPANDFFYNSFKSNNEDDADLKRMDANVDDLEVIEDAGKSKVDDVARLVDNEAKVTEEVKSDPIVIEEPEKSKESVAKGIEEPEKIQESDAKTIDETEKAAKATEDFQKSDENDTKITGDKEDTATEEDDTVRSYESALIDDDDLQTQIVEHLKDTLKSDDRIDENIESDIVDDARSETIENQIDEQEKSIAVEELPTDNDKLSKLDDEKIDNAENVDELLNLTDEQDENAEEELEEDEEEEPASVYDDYVKSSVNDENDDDDNVAPNDTEINEMRSIDDEEKNVDNEEIPFDTPNVNDEEKK